MPGRVLVVEDDAVILGLLYDLLTDEGYQILGVSHPFAVLEAARQFQPDVVIVDIMLPARSGIEVADDLRAAGFDGLPMIGMSASVIMRDLARLSGAFQVVLNKPFELTTLLGAVERLVAGGRDGRPEPQAWAHLHSVKSAVRE